MGLGLNFGEANSGFGGIVLWWTKGRAAMDGEERSGLSGRQLLCPFPSASSFFSGDFSITWMQNRTRRITPYRNVAAHIHDFYARDGREQCAGCTASEVSY